MAEILIAESRLIKPNRAVVSRRPKKPRAAKFLNPKQDQLKRAFDILVSATLFLFVFSWLFPLIALSIKLDSKGPVLFRQLRHGKDNVPFYCFKFRTMHPNREADFKQATRNDPRVTRIGSFLRKTSLDELPQFMNVLIGEMSIVGPRPHALPMNDRFSAEINNFMYRHAVRPGITGLAQAKGFRGETKTFYDIYSRCKLDIFYVDNWSLLLDMKIIAWTAISLAIKKTEVY
ncbi:MAG: sugar transferase [Lunatimonas sp.]|uniref:sugar transferase n=1 Tax=Lunatimonas sp. TaxID=2060141 RepID=UPI00263AEE06|nr:sugar transferase [Lunatimonas sp.]MCC5936761.1 sugar transferase [Lunatimonas sp.]